MNKPEAHDWDCAQIAEIPKTLVLRIGVKPFLGKDTLYVILSAQGVEERSNRRTAEWSETVWAQHDFETPLRLATKAAHAWDNACAIAEHYAKTIMAHYSGDAEREQAPEIELAHTEALTFSQMDFIHEEALEDDGWFEHYLRQGRFTEAKNWVNHKVAKRR